MTVRGCASSKAEFLPHGRGSVLVFPDTPAVTSSALALGFHLSLYIQEFLLLICNILFTLLTFTVSWMPFSFVSGDRTYEKPAQVATDGSVVG